MLNIKTQIKNFSSLSILNFANYFFSLIIFPYIVRVIGIEKFGLINFAAAFVAYFGLLSDYGFSWSATQLISINRNEKTKIDKNYSAVLSIKIILIIISFMLLSIIVFSLVRIIKLKSTELNYDFNRIYWDGRDQDGDLLANGTYLYKVILHSGNTTKNVIQKLAIIR
ncbi:MAG: oligosaccharide flippase family protein [Bacteroidetes bacterium]|nr:oligosaccharide flippase family protein [Bacteroidota bacterium]